MAVLVDPATWNHTVCSCKSLVCMNGAALPLIGSGMHALKGAEAVRGTHSFLQQRCNARVFAAGGVLACG